MHVSNHASKQASTGKPLRKYPTVNGPTQVICFPSLMPKSQKWANVMSGVFPQGSWKLPRRLLSGSVGGQGAQDTLKNVLFGTPWAPKTWKSYSLVNLGSRKREKRNRIQPETSAVVPGELLGWSRYPEKFHLECVHLAQDRAALGGFERRHLHSSEVAAQHDCHGLDPLE